MKVNVLVYHILKKVYQKLMTYKEGVIIYYQDLLYLKFVIARVINVLLIDQLKVGNMVLQLLKKNLK